MDNSSMLVVVTSYRIYPNRTLILVQLSAGFGQQGFFGTALKIRTSHVLRKQSKNNLSHVHGRQ